MIRLREFRESSTSDSFLKLCIIENYMIWLCVCVLVLLFEQKGGLQEIRHSVPISDFQSRMHLCSIPFQGY